MDDTHLGKLFFLTFTECFFKPLLSIERVINYTKWPRSLDYQIIVGNEIYLGVAQPTLNIIVI